jgi:transposase InsO family protein
MNEPSTAECWVTPHGPEFVAKDLRKWLAGTGAKTLYIEPGSPWENGYCESFNSKLKDEFLNGEIGGKGAKPKSPSQGGWATKP